MLKERLIKMLKGHLNEAYETLLYKDETLYGLGSNSAFIVKTSNLFFQEMGIDTQKNETWYDIGSKTNGLVEMSENYVIPENFYPNPDMLSGLRKHNYTGISYNVNNIELFFNFLRGTNKAVNFKDNAKHIKAMLSNETTCYACKGAVVFEKKLHDAKTESILAVYYILGELKDPDIDYYEEGVLNI